MDVKEKPGSDGDPKPGSQSSIALNHFTSNTAARVMELRKAGNVAEYVLVIEPGVRHG